MNVRVVNFDHMILEFDPAPTFTKEHMDKLIEVFKRPCMVVSVQRKPNEHNVLSTLIKLELLFFDWSDLEEAKKRRDSNG